MKAVDHREFAQQHRSLKSDIDRIQGSPPFRPSVARDEQAAVSELRRAIRALRAKLHDHFAFEEQEGGGYLLEVVTVRPTLTHKVERLRSDHDIILAALDKLIASTAQSESCETLKSSFVKTVRYLRKHEIEEMDLLQDTTIHDLGTAD
jgi:hemerythrin